MNGTSFVAMDANIAAGYRAGTPDANGMVPERVVSDGGGNPCRHCLRDIPASAPMLVLAFRPFTTTQPYAETGPVFLCAEACGRHSEEAGLPPVIASRPRFLVRAYDSRERIRYGTGGIVETLEMEARLSTLLGDPETAFVDIRSAINGCYQCRAVRKPSA